MITSINKVSVVGNAFQNITLKNSKADSIRTENSFSYSKTASDALKLNMLNYARTVRFTGALVSAFDGINNAMITCKDGDSKGEEVGKVANINKLLHSFADEFAGEDDAIKTSILIKEEGLTEKEKAIDPNMPTIKTFARTQIKAKKGSKIPETQDLLFEMVVRDPSREGVLGGKCKFPKQEIGITITPINYKGEGTKEKTYVLNTKGNLMAAIEGPDDVILTNAGDIVKKDSGNGTLEVHAIERRKAYKETINEKGEKVKEEIEDRNLFNPFVASAQPVRKRVPMPSIGTGTEVIIGMEKNRYVDEIKNSIKSFVEKVKRGDIVLDQFKEAPNAKDTQLVMLAGGYGSRAEYTNASSSKIFHDDDNGSQSTKGVFRTATGLTPMETTFVTLHNAGLLNCSADTLEIGKNIKFYLNEDINRGNGGYTIGLAKKMERPDAKSIMILPNDSMSRMTDAVIEAKKLIDSGNTAIAMIAKKVAAKDCIKNFVIMKLGNNNEILEFKEKPSFIPEGYADENNMCLTNTFQFMVSKEALKVLELVEPFFNQNADKKETRDWSKQYIPTIQTISQLDNYDLIRKALAKPFGFDKVEDFKLDNETISKAKKILGNQKLIAVPTFEPWADCGTLNQLYYTTMQIAKNDFPLEDFERAHVLSCVDTQKGIIASNKEQLERVLNKYDLSGQIMVVPMAETVDQEYIKDIPVVVNKPAEAKK